MLPRSGWPLLLCRDVALPINLLDLETVED